MALSEPRLAAVGLRVEVNEVVLELCNRVRREGFLVSRHPDRRDVLVVPVGGDVPLTAAAELLLDLGPEAFDAMEAADRLLEVVNGAARPHRRRSS